MTEAATAVVNAALVHLGEDTVASIEADPAPSRIVKIMPHLRPAIRAVLKRYGFLCALEYATLTPSADVPGNWRFPVHYVMPEGGLRLWTVERLTGWERGVWVRPSDQAGLTVIRAKQGGPLDVAYVTERAPDFLDANVADAVAFELAARACRPMNGSVERALELRKIADEAILTAIAADGQDAKADEEMITDRVAALRASAA